MAGALTANAIEARVDSHQASADPAVIADVAFLSGVEGANNVLLTAVVAVFQGVEVDTITLQWWRAGIVADYTDDLLGAEVGDPFIVDVDDDELDDAVIVVQAIDRGAGLTSGYALTVVGETGDIVGTEAICADAVLYD